MIVAAISLAAVVVLSVLLARRQPQTAPQEFNPTQFAINGALQAAQQVYGTNRDSFPLGQDLIGELHKNDPELLFAFGPQSVSAPPFASGPLPPTGVSVAVSSDGKVVVFAAQASDGSCWYATVNHESDGTDGGIDGASARSGTSYAVAQNQPQCDTGNGLPGRATAWGTSWPTS